MACRGHHKRGLQSKSDFSVGEDVFVALALPQGVQVYPKASQAEQPQLPQPVCTVSGLHLPRPWTVNEGVKVRTVIAAFGYT